MTSLIISIITVVSVVATLIIGTIWIESKRENQVREVRREAKPGEYIKIKVRHASNDRFWKGDIRVVDFVDGVCPMIKHARGSFKGCARIFPGEYVVLENYKTGGEKDA